MAISCGDERGDSSLVATFADGADEGVGVCRGAVAGDLAGVDGVAFGAEDCGAGFFAIADEFKSGKVVTRQDVVPWTSCEREVGDRWLQATVLPRVDQEWIRSAEMMPPTAATRTA
jgi:hypothetical protein